jgi:hypothetical protein
VQAIQSIPVQPSRRAARHAALAKAGKQAQNGIVDLVGVHLHAGNLHKKTPKQTPATM